jgi:hypothetical protein
MLMALAHWLTRAQKKSDTLTGTGGAILTFREDSKIQTTSNTIYTFVNWTYLGNITLAKYLQRDKIERELGHTHNRHYCHLCNTLPPHR